MNYFWDHLSAAGRRVAVVDVPHVDIAPRLNGFQLVSWGTHASHSVRASTPPSMLPEIDARFGRHPVGECDAVTSTSESKKDLRRRLLAGVHAHGELFRHCIAKQDWEVLIAVFSAPHCAGHFFWHYLDATHPLHDPQDRHGLADTIETVYRAIDREVGEMIEARRPRPARLCVRRARHGPALPRLVEPSRNSRLPGIRKRRASSPAGRDTSRRDQLLAPLTHDDARELQYAIKAVLPARLQHELMFRFYRGNRSWEKCQAFAVPNNDTVGAIRINLKGRDRNGLVEPGAEYERICDDLSAALAELSDPISGRPVVKRISRIQRELHGPRLDRLPDLTVYWEQSYPWSALRSPRFGTVELRNQDARSGSHAAHAFMLASGEGIPKGATISGASIFDLVPTILYGAGMRAPTACEGRPLFPASCAPT